MQQKQLRWRKRRGGCPFIGRDFDDNWQLDDPTGKSDEEFKAVIQKIEEKILELRERYKEER